MMTNFENAYAAFCIKEGKLANSKVDKGGLTFGGISLRFLKMLGVQGGGDINKDGIINEKDIVTLSKDDNRREELMKEHFWDKYGLGRIVSSDIATFIFLLISNTGPIEGIKIIQRAINALALYVVTVDGYLGPRTIETLNTMPGKSLLISLRVEAMRYYLRISDIDKSQRANLAGWLRRVLS